MVRVLQLEAKCAMQQRARLRGRIATDHRCNRDTHLVDQPGLRELSVEHGTPFAQDDARAALAQQGEALA